jgi:hypothetical protein
MDLKIKVLLLLLTFLFQTPYGFGASGVIDDTLQLSNEDTLNSLHSLIKADPEDGHWDLDLALVTYQSKLNATDKSNQINSDLKFRSSQHWSFGGGFNFGSSALEKITTVEPHAGITVEIPWGASSNEDSFRPSFQITAEYRYLHFHQGLSPNQANPTLVENDGYDFNMIGNNLGLKISPTKWFSFSYSLTHLNPEHIFRGRVTSQVGTRFIARRSGPLISTVATVYSDNQVIDLTFYLDPKIELSLQHVKNITVIGSDVSTDLSLLLKVEINPTWAIGYGLGEKTNPVQTSRDALAFLSYRY